MGETHGGNCDIFLARFDAGGALSWLRQVGVETAATIVPPKGSIHGGSAAGFDLASSVLIHPSGGIYVGGMADWHLGESAAGGPNYVLARFDAAGQLLGLRQMGAHSSPVPSAVASDWASGLALHPSGQLVLAGTRLSITGTVVQQGALLITFDEGLEVLGFAMPLWGSLHSCNALAIDAGSGRIVLAGGTPLGIADTNLGPGWTEDVLVTCLSPALELIWARQIGANAAAALGLFDVAQDELARGIAVDAAGDVIVVGSTRGSLDELNAGGWDVFTLKLRGGDGLPLFAAQIGRTSAAVLGIDAGGDDVLGAHPLALHRSGSILVGGATGGSLGEAQAGGGDALWLRLTKGGKLH